MLYFFVKMLYNIIDNVMMIGKNNTIMFSAVIVYPEGYS